MSASDTRQRLLEATIAAIDAGGEAAVSVDEIAKAANVTAPTIYNHFRNRDALVAAAQAERFDRQVADDFEALGNVIATVETRAQLVEVIGLSLHAFTDPGRTAMRMNRVSALGAATGRPELAAAISQKFVGLCITFAGYLQPLRDKGLLRENLDLAAFSAWFIGAITGRLFLELEPTPIDTSAWDNLMLEAVLALVLPPEGD